MIETDKQEDNWITLTTKGFDVAMQNQSERKTDKTNGMLVMLTTIIALSAYINTMVIVDNVYLKWSIVVIISLFLFRIGKGIKKNMS